MVRSYFLALPACGGADPPTVCPDAHGFCCGFGSRELRDRVWAQCKARLTMENAELDVWDGDIDGQAARFSLMELHNVRLAPDAPARSSTPSSTHVPSHSPSALSSPAPQSRLQPARSSPAGRWHGNEPPPPPPPPISKPPPPPPPPGSPRRKRRRLTFARDVHGEDVALVFEEHVADVVEQVSLRNQPELTRASAAVVRIGKEEEGVRERAAEKRRAEAEAADSAMAPSVGSPAAAALGGDVLQDGMDAYLASPREGALAGLDKDDDCHGESGTGGDGDALSGAEDGAPAGASDEEEEERRTARRRGGRGKGRHIVLDSDGEEESDAEVDDDVLRGLRDRPDESAVCAALQEQVEAQEGELAVPKKRSRRRSSKDKARKRKKSKKRRRARGEDALLCSGDERPLEAPRGDDLVSPSTTVDDVGPSSGGEPSSERGGRGDDVKRPRSASARGSDDADAGSGDAVNDDDVAMVREGMCARTAGFRKSQLRKSKAAQVPEELEKQLQQMFMEAVTQAEAGGKSARGNRSEVRKLRQGLNEASLGADAMAMSLLSQRQKKLTFAKSRIHGMGLYSLEDIPAGEFLIEYVGEVIRRPVSDVRERAYEQQGMGDSYLFRLTADLVVDATRKGSIARFINHSCEPSVEAKIIPVNGAPKIVFYTKRAIKQGEELTYDYQFAFEEEESKVACYCGAPTCRKSLN